MSVVILAAAVLIGTACALVPAGHRWPRRRRVAAWFRPAPPGRALAVVRGRPAAGADDLDAHVAALRQLAALLRSGRPPAEAWALLETTWAERLASVAAARGQWAFLRRRAAGGDPRSAAAASDLVDASRAALVAHETGAGPSHGIESHLRAAPRYQHAWLRLCWCIRLSESTGAPLSDLLNRLAGQLESEQDRRRALDATLAGPRMTQKLLAWLPALGVGLAQLLGADPLALLTGTSTGRICLAAGAVLWWANALWCRRLLAAAGPARGGQGVRSAASS